ncbi:MAG: long-chain-fatty-acid--CoA ligase [Pseudoduganella sp.]|nr:long-chain-fatty-acid--CoA ligase [Pseudoduganella sp.]
MEKIWLKSYPEGVPAEIDVSQYRSVTHLMEESFQKFADRNAYVCMDKFLTYAEVDQMSKQFGAWLQSKGLKPGARVAIMLPNVLQYPVVLAGILRAGYVVVNVNPLYTPRELQHQLNDSGAEAIVVLENFATTVEQVVASTGVKHVVVATMGDLLGGLKGTIVNFVVRNVKKMVPAWNIPGHTSFKQALAEGARQTLKSADQKPDDIAFLQYTGGTTGVSKGAVLLHSNVVANMLQNEAWLQMKPSNEQMVFVAALPLYHIYSLTISCFMGWKTGGMNILIPNPRDIPGFVKELSKYRVTVFPAVNTLYNALLNNPDFSKLDFSSYKICNGGGMAVQQSVADRWLKVTGVAGGHGQPRGHQGIHRHHRRADSIDRSGDPGRRRQGSAARLPGRNRDPRPAGDGRLLEPSGRYRQVDHAGRLLQDRRRGHHGREGLRAHRRPQEGHDPGVGLQRVSERSGRRGRRAPWRAGSRLRWCTRCELRRSGQTVCCPQGSEPDCGSVAGILQARIDRLQKAEVY